MNVIFIDFDGVLDTIHYMENKDIERKIKILSDICHTYDCKVVIESAHKDCIDEETLETDIDWIQFIFECFKKYGIECIGRTPTIEKRIDEYATIPLWKEDEIISYLESHPEIEHFCILDDDDLGPKYSDLNKVRNHLVKTIGSSRKYEEEGLLPKHKEEIGKVLELENEFRVRKVR